MIEQKKNREIEMAKKGNENRKQGTIWEKEAKEFLEKKNFEILQENFHSRYGEIDLIAKQGKYLVFVEVKYRSNEKGGHPLEAVDARKQQHICKTAEYYCLCQGYGENVPCRFDVIGILGTKIIHIENAFPFQK